MKKNGFTLIELLVVVAIIGILAAVGVTAYSGYTQNARIAKVRSDHKMLVKFLNTEFLNCETGLVTDIMDGAISCAERDGATVMGSIFISFFEVLLLFMITILFWTFTIDNFNYSGFYIASNT